MTRLCVVCRTSLTRRDNEASVNFSRRLTCGGLTSDTCGGKHRNGKAGRRRDAVREPVMRYPDPEAVARAFSGVRPVELRFREDGPARPPAIEADAPGGPGAARASEG